MSAAVQALSNVPALSLYFKYVSTPLRLACVVPVPVPVPVPGCVSVCVIFVPTGPCKPCWISRTMTLRCGMKWSASNAVKQSTTLATVPCVACAVPFPWRWSTARPPSSWLARKTNGVAASTALHPRLCWSTLTRASTVMVGCQVSLLQPKSFSHARPLYVCACVCLCVFVHEYTAYCQRQPSSHVCSCRRAPWM